MAFPATLAAATPINSPPPAVNSHLTSPLLCACSCNRSNRRSNRIPSIKSAAIVDNYNPSRSEEEEEIPAKVGARVRVTVPLKVYHIPKVSEVELSGKEGRIKEYVAVWKGKHISANFPYKIEFSEKLEGRGDAPVRFFAHLKEDEFEYVD